MRNAGAPSAVPGIGAKTKAEKRNPNRAPMMACPVCGAKGLVASSEEQTHTLRRLYYRCDDVKCGHTWVAHLAYIETLSPSAHGPVDPLRLRVRPAPDPLTRPFTLTRPPGGEPSAA